LEIKPVPLFQSYFLDEQTPKISSTNIKDYASVEEVVDIVKEFRKEKLKEGNESKIQEDISRRKRKFSIRIG
jgi:hypothetical protein